MDVSLGRAVPLGDEGAVSAALLHHAELEFRAGNWPLAARYAVDGYEHAEQMGREQDMSALLYASALVDAHLGRFEEARDAAERGTRSPISRGDEGFRFQHLAGARLPRALALATLRPPTAPRPPAARLDASGWREPSIYGELPNAIESLVDTVDLGEARRTPGRSAGARRPDREPLGRRQRRPLRRVDPGRRRRPPRLPSPSLERAVTVHERLPQPFELARTLLVLGVTQRRARQRRAARETRSRALAVLEDLGSVLWAERRRGPSSRASEAALLTRDDLTPSERRIAELVAEGKTDKEVAAILVLRRPHCRVGAYS